MKDWLMEVLTVFAYSTKAQIALLAGCLGFFAIHAYGSYAIDNIELHGLFANITEIIRDKLGHRYDKAALIWLTSCLVLAIRAYRKDRKRLLGI